MREKPPRQHASRGFALIITLSLMMLLVVLAVGMLSLSSISLRNASHLSAEATARANARMALTLAIGELQITTGPDQRITMTSGLRIGDEPPNPNWTGAIDVSPDALTADAKSAPIRWLVSGDQPNPATALTLSPQLNQGNAIKLGSFNSTPEATTDLLAPVVNAAQGNDNGRYAWWIGDEGTKARVDLARPVNPTATERDRLARSQTPHEAGLANINPDWAAFAPVPFGTIDKTALASMGTASLAAENLNLATEHFNDVTTGGHGLPVNVAAGGMKADLSLIFDTSQASKPFGEFYFGATPSPTSLGSAGSRVSVYNFAIHSRAKFFLSDALSKNGSVPTGPNWGNLWNYATLWQNVSNHQAPAVTVNPEMESDMRLKTWVPYTNHNEGRWRRDIQHTNSPLNPILSLFQVSFRLTSELVPPPIDNPDLVQYRAQITMQPVIGLWNPHNVTIQANPYALFWALYPYFRLNYAKPTGTGSFTDLRFTELWLREVWVPGTGPGYFPTPENPLGSKYFNVTTEAVDLQPGEFRIFSARDKITAPQVNQNYQLKPGWSENGGFVVNLKAPDGSNRLIPEGYRAWFGDIYFLDTQSPQTLARYPQLDTELVSSTWFNIKTNGGSSLRAADMWNSGSNATIPVPERVLSGWNGSTTTKPTYLIEDLADDRTAAHIATWSFFNRTTNQVEEESQRLRGWIDSNPRALVSNSLWDGSRVDSSSQRSGWHSTSNWIGAYNPPGRPRVVGDGHGGNRGLLAEGGSAIPEPEVMRADGRYQGFGGAANTFAGGRTHAIIYDVPRSPLISLGQFQHAQLSRYNFEPGFVVGNSYANPRIPLDATINPNFNGITGFNITDVSHDVNRKLWDGYFFSTLGPDYVAGSGSFDTAFDFKELASATSTLPNPRMLFSPLPGDTTIEGILADNGERAPQAIAARIMVKGAFNVNSTSTTAWKAVLSSMGASELPTLNPQTGAVSWDDPGGIRFNRFGHVISNQPYEKGGTGHDDPFWQGWRNISDAELDALAGEIVKEVKQRGPFRSLAEFINRNPAATDESHRLKGAIQSALDRTINADLPESVGRAATRPDGAQFSDAVTDENVAAGSASYLMQGDVLQSLAPILQVRSDYFRIRACGEALDADGQVIARAWCEAYVQRTSSYVDPLDQPHTVPADLAAAVNQTFGRGYEVVSFRWLSGAEL